MNKTIRIVQGGFMAIFRLYHYFRNYQRYKRKHTDMGGNFIDFCFTCQYWRISYSLSKTQSQKLTEKQSDRIFLLLQV